jgi:hypothetical protein
LGIKNKENLSIAPPDSLEKHSLGGVVEETSIVPRNKAVEIEDNTKDEMLYS